MPNGQDHKKYGEHKYDRDGTGDCKYGCGCWVGDSRSRGPLGLDPFGKCPNNPVNGKKQEGKADYHDVVEQRINELESRAQRAEDALKAVSPDKKKLVKKIERLKRQLGRRDCQIAGIKEVLKRKW